MTWLWIDLALAAALLLTRFLLFQLVWVKGRSMLPTLENRQFLLVSLLDYRLRAPRRHEIVICHYPGRRMRKCPVLQENFVKRIVGLPGETVEIIEGVVHIDGAPLDEPFLGEAQRIYCSSRPPVTLGKDEYFVMGDNRPASNDSRRVGPLPRRMIVGHVRRILFPLTKSRRV